MTCPSPQIMLQVVWIMLHHMHAQLLVIWAFGSPEVAVEQLGMASNGHPHTPGGVVVGGVDAGVLGEAGWGWECLVTPCCTIPLFAWDLGTQLQKGGQKGASRVPSGNFSAGREVGEAGGAW